jgi:PmbA protein
MKQELLDICQWVIDKATSMGATDCKASLANRKFVEINYLDKQPEVIKEATTQSLSVDIFVGQKYSNQSTPDLRKSTLEQFLKRAIDNTQFMEEDPYRKLPEEGYYDASMYQDLEIADQQYKNHSPEKRHEISQQIESSCIETGGDKVISVEAGCYDDRYESVMMNSKGFVGQNESTQFWAGASMTAKDEGDRKPAGYYWVGSRFIDDLPQNQVIGAKAAEKTLELLGARKIKTEKLPIIIENSNVGRVLSGLLSATYGSNIQQQSSFLIAKKGVKIGSDLLTLMDDPFKKKGFASRLYDGDGLKAQPMQPFTNGVLNEYYIDWYYSQKLGVAPTSSGPSNLSMPTGDQSVTELMKDLKRGILINGFIGGNSNVATGDFSLGITGHLFDNGELVQPVAEMNMADNHLEFWKKLIATANDPWLYGSWNLPSLVFEDVVVSGG